MLNATGLREAFEGSDPDDTATADASGDEAAVVRAALEDGVDDESALTNLVFFRRHPELGGRSLEPDEHDFAAEWIKIRNDVVRSHSDDRPSHG